MNKVQVLLLAVVLCAVSVLHSQIVKPLYNYDFKTVKIEGKRLIFSTGKKTGSSDNVMKLENGMLCCVPPQEKAYCQAAIGALRTQDTAIDIRFKLNSPIAKRAALFTYSENAWDQAQLGIHITAKSEAQIRINLTKEETPVKFTLTSTPQNFEPGKLHTLRTTLQTGGFARIYLDGRLIAETDNAPGLATFKAPVVKWHPYATIGCTMERNTPEQYLDGYISAVIIYDVIPELVTANAVSDDVNIVFKHAKVSPVIDGKLDEKIYSEVEWTKPFRVLGRENTEINGVWVNADDKFNSVAGTAALLYDDNNVYAAYRCPVLNGMKATAGDGIEFFLRPDNGVTWQMLVQADGSNQTLSYATPYSNAVFGKIDGAKSAAAIADGIFTVELMIPLKSMGLKSAPVAGDLWRGNFCRTGDTCGGLSTWSPVGTFFFAPDGFGKLICESRSVYFKRELESLKKIVGENNAGIFAETEKELAKNGDKATGWDAACNAMNAANNLAAQQLSDGKNLLVWHGDVWSDFTPDMRMPFGQMEVEALQIATPRNSRGETSFFARNLSNRTQLLSLNFTAQDKDFESALRFREIGYIELSGKRMIPDPVFDLPNGNVLRIAPGQTVAVWVDVDTKALNAGKYSGTIQIVPGYSVGEKKSIKLDLVVGNVDIAKVPLKVWTYPLRWPKNIRALKDYPFNVSCLLPTQFLPEPKADGTFDFREVDEIMETFVQNGIHQDQVFFLLYTQWPQWSSMKLADGRKVSFGAPGWKEELGKRLTAFRDYAKSKYNMDYSRYALYTNDEPNGDPNDKNNAAYFAIEGAKIVRGIDPRIQLFTNPWKLEPQFQKYYFENFNILEPFLPQLSQMEDMMKQYTDSGLEIWSYSILVKSSSPLHYRRMFMTHLKHGYEGPATFYDLWDHHGDPYNSYDKGKSGTSTDDWQAVYRNKRINSIQVSRRMEAWYQGIIDFKLAKFCRKQLKDAGKSTDVLDQIIAKGSKQDSNLEAIRTELFELAESLK